MPKLPFRNRPSFLPLALFTAAACMGGIAPQPHVSSGASRPATPTASLPIEGTWVFAEDRGKPSPSGSHPGCVGERFTIRDTKDAIEIDWTVEGETFTHSYPKDGSEVESEDLGERGKSTTKHSGVWKDNRLTIRDTTDGPGPAGVRIKMVSAIVIRRLGEDLLVEKSISKPLPVERKSLYRREGSDATKPEQAPPPAAPKPAPSTTPAAPVMGNIQKLAWLAGHWSGTMRGATLEEFWTPPAGGAMLATTRIISAERMTEFEFLRIVERDGSLVFIAQPSGEPPTEFTLTQLTDRSFTVENASNDFPQRVSYRLGDEPESVIAEISDLTGAKVIRFSYRRAK